MIATDSRSRHNEHMGKQRHRKKNPIAVAFGRLGAAKGGAARAKKLSAARRKEIASLAAKARWEEK